MDELRTETERSADVRPGEHDAEVGPEAVSVDALRESILRRIMRAACAVGLLGIASALLTAKPFNTAGLVLGSVATACVFGLTLVPFKTPILSRTYPWVLVLLGVALAYLMGLRADALLLVAGGLFIASLVLGTSALLALGATTVALGAIVVWSRPGPMSSEEIEAWSSSVSAMAAVVVPAAIAGRMLVDSLSKTLLQREGLMRRAMEERRALESTLETLESTRAQLTHAQKVELMSQMAGGIAHDMNNALTTIMGEASLLDESRTQRDNIVEAAAYAAKLTHQLMVFGRRDVSRPLPIDAAATVRGFLQAIRRLLPSDIRFTAELPDEPTAVIADRTHLLQVLLNLTGNAKDAMPNGGSLTLRVSKDAEREQAVIEVVDTGIGITAEALPEIFDPFYTTKAPGHGTGLGLANVRQLVDSMGGSVAVQSELGRGTAFEIRLPLTSQAVREEESPLSLPSKGGGSVLVVDDDVRVRAVVFTALERAGYQVWEAAGPTAALELMRSSAKRVDLLLTDVVMAEGGGAEVVRSFRAAYPDVRVLVMSGYNDDEALRRGISLGEYPFIAKPFTADELIHAVASAIATPPHASVTRQSTP